MVNNKLIIFLLFSGFLAKAQVKQAFYMEGNIKVPQEDMEGVVVQNISSAKATVTNIDGKFQLEVIVGDTIEIRAIQFTTERFVVQPYMKNETLTITLVPRVNQLKEVVVMPYNLTGNLLTDIQPVDTKIAEIPFKLGIPNIGVKRLPKSNRMLIEATSGSGIIPLNPIINAITGRTKRIKKAITLEKEESKIQNAKNQFDTLVFKALKIPKDRIDDFIYFCAADSLYLKMLDKKDTIKILEFLENKSQVYRVNNKLD